MTEHSLEPHRAGIPKVALPSLQRSELRLVLDQVRSAHNVGALFRTADAAAVDCIYLLGLTPHPPQPQLKKTALGATTYVPWKHRKTAQEVIEELSAEDYRLVALDNGPGSIELWHHEWTARTALVGGNEVDGVSEALLRASVTRVSLPMFGFKRSLNVTTSLGIAIYDYLRTFRFEPG